MNILCSIFWFFYSPWGLIAWIVIAMWHLRRQHKIREKSTALYYALLIPDGLGFIADVLANYTWASIVLMDCPRGPQRVNREIKPEWKWPEKTISQHMGRILDDFIEIENPSLRQRWSNGVATFVCSWLDRLDPSGHHCSKRT